MKIVNDRVVGETLDLLLHLQVLVNGNLKAASHLLIVDLILLTSQLLFIQVYNLWQFRRDIQIKSLVNFLFDHFQFLHHQSLLALPTLHIIDPLLFDAILNFLLRGLVDVVKYLELGACCVFRLPLAKVIWIERFIIIYEIS